MWYSGVRREGWYLVGREDAFLNGTAEDEGLQQHPQRFYGETCSPLFKKVFGEGSRNDSFFVDENLPSAPVPPMNPVNILEIPEEDQLLQDDEVQGQLPEADEVQGQLPEADEVQGQLPEADEVQGQLPEADEVQGQLPEADEVQDLEDLISKLLDDEDLKDAVIFKSTKLFSKGKGHWVAEPHVRVWSNRLCSIV